jgi:hypothetical protein
VQSNNRGRGGKGSTSSIAMTTSTPKKVKDEKLQKLLNDEMKRYQQDLMEYSQVLLKKRLEIGKVGLKDARELVRGELVNDLFDPVVVNVKRPYYDMFSRIKRGGVMKNLITHAHNEMHGFMQNMNLQTGVDLLDKASTVLRDLKEIIVVNNDDGRGYVNFSRRRRHCSVDEGRGRNNSSFSFGETSFGSFQAFEDEEDGDGSGGVGGDDDGDHKAPALPPALTITTNLNEPRGGTSVSPFASPLASPRKAGGMISPLASPSPTRKRVVTLCGSPKSLLKRGLSGKMEVNDHIQADVRWSEMT